MISTAITYTAFSMNQITDLAEAVESKHIVDLERMKEKYEIVTIRNNNNQFNMTVKNMGDLPVHLTRLWVENTTDSSWPIAKYDLDIAIPTGTSVNNIGQNLGLTALDTQSYLMILVTERGTTQKLFVNSVSAEPLYMSLHILPTAVSQNFPVTLLFTVVNNMTSDTSLYNLTPALDFTTGGTATETLVSGPIPTKYPVLKSGGVATFEYIYTVDGVEASTANFGVSLINGYPLPGDPSHLQSINGTITVKDVEIAVSAGSSITSQGLITPLTIEPELLFHDQSWGVPLGWPALTKQMDGSTSFGAGAVFNTANGPIIFISSNKTNTESQTLSSGIYNASLQYYSNATAPGIPDPSLAFFFECEDCPGGDKTPESIGTLSLIDSNANLGYLQIGKDSSNDPTWNEFGGPDNDGYFHFSQVNSFLEGMWKGDAGDNSYNNIGTVPDTDSMWVRIPYPAEEYMPLLFMGEKVGKDVYEISIGDEGVPADVGKIVFRFEEEGGSKTKCITDSGGPTNDGRYDNNKWQLITVIRTGGSTTHDTDCEIWVNATDTGAVYRINGADSNLDEVKVTGIGNNEKGKSGMDSSTQQLNADVAMWMHWNDDELTASQIEDLYYTNYGENGTRVHMQINHTNNDGSVIYSTLDVVDFEIPFYDPSANSTQSSGDPINALFDNTDPDALWKYSRFNVTGTTSSSSSFVQGDRLTFSISVDDDEQNLPINLWIDDADYSEASLDDTNSFLQTPPIEPAWPTFSAISQGQTTTLSIFNSGPEGIWFTFTGTRFVVTSLDGLTSYGAMPWCATSANPCTTEPITLNSVTHPLNIDEDGPYIPDQNTAQITFNVLCDPVQKVPNPPSSCNFIPVGDYKGYIYLSGYDEEGTSFIRTIALGLLHVTA